MMSVSVFPQTDRWWLRALWYAWPVLIVAVFGLGLCIHTLTVIVTASDPGAFISKGGHHVLEKFHDNIFTNPFFLIGIPFILLLQVVLPVSKAQSSFNSSTRVDFMFTILMVFFYALITPSFRDVWGAIYNQFFWYLSFSQKIEFPNFLQYVFGYLVVDFLGWVHHVIRHKVPVFWEFHAVHHSQTRMNPFANERIHPFDSLFANSIKFIPAFFFAHSFQIVLGYIVIHRFLDHLNHSNVRTHLGCLRYVFVTPQSHRVHHSVQPEHADCNFGVSLSIWDHLFGTQCRDYEVYPETGINNPDYPSELDGSMSGVIFSVKEQLLFPFVRVWKRCRSLAHLKN